MVVCKCLEHEIRSCPAARRVGSTAGGFLLRKFRHCRVPRNWKAKLQQNLVYAYGA